ncbi:MAG: Immunoglobulin I-set domain-containing protein/repeat domain (List_Bact_rpt) [Verrucomicrobia bacterium]|nr:MAG: Immunoglobulin I-set domain-containing protein/repeat domain (List_Bact_rpt) [Verrucomicrobiota bacterium]
MLLSGFQAGVGAAVLTLLESSEPAGYVSGSASQNSGATYTSSTAPGTVDAYSFSFWRLNGVRQADAAGRSLNPVTFVPTANTTLVAVYTLTATDTDNDGLLDAFELEFFGDLSKTAGADSDGDSLSNALEKLLGNHPGLPDNVSEGGLSARFSPVTLLPFSNSYYPVQTISDPPGFLDPVTQYVTGATTVTLPVAPDSVNGCRFAGWYLGMARADAPTALQPVNLSVSGATVFTAKYVLESTDSDGDAILDWYEWFGFSGLSQAVASDPDSDGLDLVIEQIFGFAPYLTDTVSEGGLAMRFSSVSDLNLGGYRSLRVTSDPPGFQGEFLQWGEPGGTLQTPDLFASVVNGYRFVGWYVDGALVQDATTAAAGSASILMNTDRVAVAKYVLETEDTDADGIPDWQEMLYYAALGASGTTEADGDGLQLALEFLLGYHPGLVDVVSEGGLSMRFSPVANAVFDWLPVITRQPVALALKGGESGSLSVEVEGFVGVSYRWSKDGVSLAGGTSASFTIVSAQPTDAGSYSVVVSGPAGSVTSGSARLTVTDNAGVLNSRLSAVVSGSINQQVLTPTDPLGYSASNVPPGVAFNASTGVLSGSPMQAGNYAVSITGASPGAVPLTFEINVALLDPGLVGTFQGWIERNPTLNKNLGSTLQITTTSKGAYSGKLVSGVTATAFRGSLLASPASSTLAPQTARIVCVLPKTNVTLDVALDSAGNVLSGTLSDGSVNTVGVDGWRNVWLTIPGNASAFKGLHTFYLQQPNDTDENLPQGSGFGSLLVSAKSGVSTLTTCLSDGTKMSSATFVGPNGEVCLYGSLYTNLGSVLGRLEIDADNNVSGNPTWMRPDLSAKPALTYRAGFAPMELTVGGGLYVPPNKGELIMGLSPGADNAELVFRCGGLSEDMNQAVTVTSLGSTSVSNRITVPVNINQVRVSILSVSTGAFSGSFMLPGATAADARKANFYGQLVQTPGGAVNGYGYFLLPKPPVAGQTMTTAPKLSGSLLLSSPQF